MSWVLARPSFWPEPRDPWAWQRALRVVSVSAPVPDPRPCWQQILGPTLSRRSVAGLYGLRDKPAPPTVLGLGLLEHGEGGWRLSPAGEGLAGLDREKFQAELAATLVRRSAWVRLALFGLASGRWHLPRGTAPLRVARQVRLPDDLVVAGDALKQLPNGRCLLGDLSRDDTHDVVTEVRLEELSALHSPLYLLHAQGWLDERGDPRLPDDLAANLAIETPAGALRRIAGEEQDANGFVPLSRVAERFRTALASADASVNRASMSDIAGWTDEFIGGAIESGAIEVHAWAPGQPRHGRGLYGDRNRKLVRWTVHDDLQMPTPTIAPNKKEVDR